MGTTLPSPSAAISRATCSKPRHAVPRWPRRRPLADMPVPPSCRCRWMPRSPAPSCRAIEQLQDVHAINPLSQDSDLKPEHVLVCPPWANSPGRNRAGRRALHAVVEGCSASGDWRPFADLFTEDVVYTEHHYGVFHGREAVRDWIVAVMAPFPHMRFPSDWTAYDEDNDAVVIMIKNLLDHPTDPKVSRSGSRTGPGWSTPGTACSPARRTSTTRTAMRPAWWRPGCKPAASSRPTRSCSPTPD